MPRLIQPNLPEEVEVTVAFMGNRAQVAILRALAIEGPSTIGALSGHVKMSRPSLNKHLVSLEAVGLIVGDPAKGARHGKTVLYAANLRKLRTLVDQCLAYVAGGD
ncbi:ArsR/SmtB family transcription factor [Arthrobacter sp. MDT3-44]